jgi:hypothetical protein
MKSQMKRPASTSRDVWHWSCGESELQRQPARYAARDDDEGQQTRPYAVDGGQNDGSVTMANRVGALRTIVCLAAAALLGSVMAASAVMTTKRYDLDVALAVQPTFHHQDVQRIEWVQQREELRLGGRYRPVLEGQPFLVFNSMELSVLWRGRYDAIFDIRDRYHGRLRGNPTSMPTATGTVQIPVRKLTYTRDDYRFPEGKLPREAYLDLAFVKPLDDLTLRIGRQQVVWGEADLLRSLDVVNPLRLDQMGLVGDEFDAYREPLWIAKALYNVGMMNSSILPIGDANLEILYSPNWRGLDDRLIFGEIFRETLQTNNTLTGLSRSQAIPFRKVRHPWELDRVGTAYGEIPSQADLSPGRGCGDLLGCADFVWQTRTGGVTKTLDLDASMAGVRFLGKTIGGLDFSLNYLWKRAEVPGTPIAVHQLFDAANPNPPGGTSPNIRVDKLLEAAAAEATPLDPDSGIPTGRMALIERCLRKEPVIFLQSIHGPKSDGTTNLLTGCINAAQWYPYTHIVGATATYNDYNFTGAIFRLEQSFSTKEPRNGAPPLAGPRAGQYPTARDFDTSNKRDTRAWKSMIGFDYLAAFPKYAPPFVLQYKYLRTWFTDQWLLSGQFLTEYYSNVSGQVGNVYSITDREQHWNPIFTFVATGFFLNNLFRPWIAAGYDVNAEFPLLWLQGTYFISKKVAVRVGSIQYFGSGRAESFLYLNKYADRDTLFARLTYYLL